MATQFSDGEILAGAKLNAAFSERTLATDLANTSDLTKGAALVGRVARDVANITTLRTLVGSGQVTMNLLGYYTPGDGGGGPFYWNSTSTATDNGGTVILPTGYAGTGRWVRLGSVITSKHFGARLDGAADDTVAVQSFINASVNADNFVSSPGTSMVGKLTVPSNARIHWQEGTTLKAKSGLNDHVLVNSDSTNGNTGIVFTGHLAIDGNYLNQTAGNGITFSLVSSSNFGTIEANNCRGHGILFSDCNGNKINRAVASSNGKASAGYGCYLYNSSDNKVDSAYVSDNCIGCAVEASGTNKVSSRNQLSNITARSNRADYSQSGAGVHFEQSAGGVAGDNTIINPDCRGSTGVGINLTSTNNIRIVEPVCRDNAKSGIAAIQSLNVQILGGEFINNAAGEAAGYQAQLRFDDAGLTGCSGRIQGVRASGSAIGLKTFTTGCAVIVESSDITGSGNNYVLTGTGDAINTVAGNGQVTRPRQSAFNAGKTAGTSTAGTIVFDSVLFDHRGDYNATTGQFTAPVAGTYLFCVNIRDGATTEVQWELRIGTVARLNAMNSAGVATKSGANGPIILDLLAGDVVSVALISGDTYGGTAQTNFSGYFFG